MAAMERDRAQDSFWKWSRENLQKVVWRVYKKEVSPNGSYVFVLSKKVDIWGHFLRWEEAYLGLNIGVLFWTL